MTKTQRIETLMQHLDLKSDKNKQWFIDHICAIWELEEVVVNINGGEKQPETFFYHEPLSFEKTKIQLTENGYEYKETL